MTQIGGEGRSLTDTQQRTAEMIAKRIGAYEISGSLGAGGMGEVYLATDTRLGRKVALKILPRDLVSEDRIQRLAQEARAASALNHPNIVTIHELGEIEGTPYIVQEYVEGETLRQRLRHGPLGLADAIDIATQIATALSAAHEAGIVHRDIKPDNIMLRRDGLVKVLDFGLAKVSADSGPKQLQTAAGVILGTISYMSPEQARREALDARTDVWSLGVVLYEMLSGHRPFDAPSASETLARILDNEPQPVAVAGPVQRILNRMLAKDRDVRYADGGAVLHDLRSIPKTRKISTVALAAAAAVVVIALIAIPMFRRTEPEKLPAPKPVTIVQPKSVAVLPFANLSGGAENDYFSDGMTEEIINALARLQSLKVVSRTSVFAFKGKSSDIRDVAAKLGVTNVVEGSVRRQGKRLRVDAQLVNAADGYQLWSQTFDREMTDVFSIQSEIATAVADALRVRLGGSPIAPASSTRNVDAYDAYLKGRQATGDWTRQGLERAVSYFRLAIEHDPSFAQAWAGLGDAYSLMDHRPGGSTLQPEESYRLAEEAANHALALDPDSAEAHAALGHIYTHTGRFADAEGHSRRAVELNPNSAMAHAWYATYLRVQRRFREAKEHFMRARELDPYSSLVAQLGTTVWAWGEYDVAADSAQRAIEIDPDYGEFSGILARVRALQGRFAEAHEALDRAAAAKRPSFQLDQERAIVLSAEGRRSEALELLRKVKPGDKSVSGLMMFRAYAAAGDVDAAIRSINEWVKTSPYHARVNMDLPDHPLFRALLADARYRKVRADFGLPPIEVNR